MPLLQPFLLGVVLPAIIVCLVLAVAWRPWRRGQVGASVAWGGALAIGGAYLSAYLAVLGKPPLVPVQASDWFPYLTLAAVMFGVFEPLWLRRPFLRWGMRAFLVALVLIALLRRNVRTDWTLEEVSFIWLAALEVAGLIASANLDGLAKHHSAAMLFFILLLVTAGSSLVVLLSGSALLAQLGGSLAAALGASLLMAIWNPATATARGTLPVVFVIWAGMWLTGYFYADVSPACALLLSAAPLTAWISRAPIVRRLAPWQKNLIQTVVILVPVALAVIFSLQASAPAGYEED